MKLVLPPSAEIGEYYDRQVRALGGEYISFRWGRSRTQRKHFEQTLASLRALLEQFPVQGSVLEIGAGPAVWTELYIGGVEKLTLLDISAEMLKTAQARIDSWANGQYSRLVKYVCGDVLETELPERGFDSIITIRAFEYFSDKRTFLERCAKWLRPGGRLIVGTKNFDWKDAQADRARVQHAGMRDCNVGAAMQADLMSLPKLAAMARDAGLKVLESRALVFGSYLRQYRLPGSLWAFDRLHRMYALRTMTPRSSTFIESYVVVAERPADSGAGRPE